jgi:uncharacterized protein (DUF2164 family)
MGNTILDRKEKAATVAAVKARLTQTVGGMIDDLSDLRELKREHEAEIEKINAEFAGIEATLSKELERQGLEKANGKKASASYSTMTHTNVEDWDAFLDFIYENRYGHLIQRRAADAACTELRELGREIPGTSVFIKKRLNLRSI